MAAVVDGAEAVAAVAVEDCSPAKVRWCGHWKQFENGRVYVGNFVVLPKLLVEQHRLRTLPSVREVASVCA